MASSTPSCAIRSIVESMLRSVLENVLGGIPGNILGVYLEAFESLPGSIESSRLRMCNTVELEAYLRSYSGVYLRTS